MLKTIVVFLIVGALISGAAATLVGAKLTKPHLQEAGEPPAALPAQLLKITRSNAAPIAAWYVPNNSELGSVLLLHGIRSTRTQMISRARFLHKAGYSVLLIDMQGHGETPGARITFGYRESRDVRDSIAYLRKLNPDRPVGVIGVSLGGAAALLNETPLNVNALVVEAVYNNIEKATKNRLEIQLGAVGPYLAPLLLLQIKPYLGISLASLSPASAIARHRVPVFVIAGENDARTTVADSHELYKNASEPKTLWIIPNAKHQDFHAYAPEEYESRVLNFLQSYMHG